MKNLDDIAKETDQRGWFFKLCLILFMAFVGWCLLADFEVLPVSEKLLPLGTLSILAALLTIVTLMRRVPVENSVIASIFVITISGIIGIVGSKTGVPFGPIHFAPDTGWKLFHLVPWYMPLIWLTLLIQSRGVARLIMRPWRRTNYYGLWMIALTSLLTVLLDLALEPFATRIHHLWSWNTTMTGWYDTPWINFVGWFGTCLVILACTSLWFINKKPVKQEPSDYAPLVIWLVIDLFLTEVLARHHLWGAALFSSVVAVVTWVAACWGGRRSY